MKYYSPLRYPGGKRRLANFIAKICVENKINGHYIEPYAGGASVALYLLLNGHVKEITINDLDRSIYAFWHSVLNKPQQFCRLIKNADVSVAEWRKQKEVQGNKTNAPLLALGFSTFFLNRTNVSGIIDGGIIGGLKQNGKYKIDCRFNKDELIQRIKLIAKHKKNIHLKNADALKLVRDFRRKGDEKNAIFYFDPPYYIKGASLYMHSYKHGDHAAVSDEIKKIRNARWVVSYDDTPEIVKLYKKNTPRRVSFFHTAYIKNKIGREIVFFSKGLRVPIGNLLG